MVNASTELKLRQELDASHVDIIDNSWRHAGHTAMAGIHQAEGTHLAITIVSPRFEGVSLLNRHRQVHQCLQAEFAGVLHALELKTYTPAEWEQKP